MKKAVFTRREDRIWIVGTDPFVTAGTVGRDANTIDYTLPKETIRFHEKELLSLALDLPAANLFFLDQEHGDEVVEAAEPNSDTDYVFATADALTTCRERLCLVVRTADCVPVIITDASARCAAAVHSGWKSTEKRITVKAARLLCERYGASYENMKVYVLPAVSLDSYQVGDDFEQKFPGATERQEDGLHADLPKAIVQSLIAEGIPAENISQTGLCTVKENERFFSHRKGDKGRNLNFVVMQ